MARLTVRLAFFGGTYFPPHDQHGQVGFPSLLRIVAAKWRAQPDSLRTSGLGVLDAITKATAQARLAVPEDELGRRYAAAAGSALEHYRSTYDRAHGGFGGPAKFPAPPGLALLLRLAAGRGEGSREALAMAVGTLGAMARGGIRDHLEGGFHRYTVDSRWHLPHFEKMLYDQGQLLGVFAAAHAAHPEPLFKAAAEGLYEYLARHLRHPGGAFYSAEDADSLPAAGAAGKREGAFALWSAAELREVLPAPLRDLAAQHYGVREGGNIDPAKDPHGEMAGLNVLDTTAAPRADPGRPQLEVEEALAEARRLLAARRAARPRPSRDDKVLTAWNGLAISGLCRAYRVFGLDARYLRAAEEACAHILERHTAGGRQLRRTGSIDAFADDYAFLIQGLLDLYEATLRRTPYLETAVALQQEMNARYWDSGLAAFTASPCEPQAPETALPMRLVDDYDGAEPSANSVAAMNLLRLRYLTDDLGYEGQRLALLGAFAARVSAVPQSMATLLEAAVFASAGPVLAVIDAPSLAAAEELHLAALASFHPSLLLRANIAPGLAARAHVCRGTHCSEPVADGPALVRLLRSE